MSTHRGSNVRVSKRNKKALEDIRDFVDLDSQDDAITFLLISAAPMPQRKRKQRFDPFSI